MVYLPQPLSNNVNSSDPLANRDPRNFDLHVTSSCHRIKVYSINRQRLDTANRLKQLELRGESLLPITKPLEFNLETDEHYDAIMTAKGGRDPAE